VKSVNQGIVEILLIIARLARGEEKSHIVELWSWSSNCHFKQWAPVLIFNFSCFLFNAIIDQDDYFCSHQVFKIAQCHHD